MHMNAVIVEDERKSRDTLKHLLTEFCPEVLVQAEARTVQEARQMLREEAPELVFLDIHLPQENGFALFDYFAAPSFDVVFTTAYDQYAVQAFRLAAIDYLLKPIDIGQLQDAVQRVCHRRQAGKAAPHYDLVRETLKAKPDRIALPTGEGFAVFDTSEILYCEASRNYSLFHLKGGEKVVVSKPLKAFEEMLERLNFFRINRSYIINLNFLRGYSRKHRGEVLLSNGLSFSISPSRKEAFLQSLPVTNKESFG